MKVLGGVIEPDSGTIRTDGVERRALSVRDALDAGIAFVHQELNLFENLDVAANVYIGREVLTGGPLKLVDDRRCANACSRFSSGSAATSAPIRWWRACRSRNGSWWRSPRRCR